MVYQSSSWTFGTVSNESGTIIGRVETSDWKTCWKKGANGLDSSIDPARRAAPLVRDERMAGEGCCCDRRKVAGAKDLELNGGREEEERGGVVIDDVRRPPACRPLLSVLVSSLGPISASLHYSVTVPSPLPLLLPFPPTGSPFLPFFLLSSSRRLGWLGSQAISSLSLYYLRLPALRVPSLPCAYLPCPPSPTPLCHPSSMRAPSLRPPPAEVPDGNAREEELVFDTVQAALIRKEGVAREEELVFDTVQAALVRHGPGCNGSPDGAAREEELVFDCVHAALVAHSPGPDGAAREEELVFDCVHAALVAHSPGPDGAAREEELVFDCVHAALVAHSPGPDGAAREEELVFDCVHAALVAHGTGQLQRLELRCVADGRVLLHAAIATSFWCQPQTDVRVHMVTPDGTRWILIPTDSSAFLLAIGFARALATSLSAHLASAAAQTYPPHAYVPVPPTLQLPPNTLLFLDITLHRMRKPEAVTAAAAAAATAQGQSGGAASSRRRKSSTHSLPHSSTPSEADLDPNQDPDMDGDMSDALSVVSAADSISSSFSSRSAPVSPSKLFRNAWPGGLSSASGLHGSASSLASASAKTPPGTPPLAGAAASGVPLGRTSMGRAAIEKGGEEAEGVEGVKGADGVRRSGGPATKEVGGVTSGAAANRAAQQAVCKDNAAVKGAVHTNLSACVGSATRGQNRQAGREGEAGGEGPGEGFREGVTGGSGGVRYGGAAADWSGMDRLRALEDKIDRLADITRLWLGRSAPWPASSRRGQKLPPRGAAASGRSEERDGAIGGTSRGDRRLNDVLSHHAIGGESDRESRRGEAMERAVRRLVGLGVGNGGGIGSGTEANGSGADGNAREGEGGRGRNESGEGRGDGEEEVAYGSEGGDEEKVASRRREVQEVGEWEGGGTPKEEDMHFPTARLSPQEGEEKCDGKGRTEEELGKEAQEEEGDEEECWDSQEEEVIGVVSLVLAENRELRHMLRKSQERERRAAERCRAMEAEINRLKQLVLQQPDCGEARDLQQADDAPFEAPRDVETTPQNLQRADDTI
ncbi:unnamed protein product [Closterium sp. NIES-65]|nr:unnamed protein product [Closterium sp. NIES-65]